ncbi:enoyl-CoA hydratase/isomerase family protein [Parasphingorhabdus halotolerans]|uniref:Enoyl-CoA hydratase/isomerase family protein n=2 Tax=Parasphingorhabdus halotolerans TaxID=2725558 RepID=A0A6H2DQT8_9SPHN|nr:enoyl-CoA hydratase/isomerase family protein [Parasphingorhabdus halotolerans]
MVHARLPRESFGPSSPMPFLAVNLEGSDAALGKWLRDLPCPIIGIGSGALTPFCDVLLDDNGPLDRIAANIEKAPVASMVLVQHLRASESLSIQDALTAESFAYATVQKGLEFLEWLHGHERSRNQPIAAAKPLLVEMDEAQLNLNLNDPDNLNAIGVTLRDALCEALDLALTDKSIERINLTGTGRSFSIGGETNEFGEVSDPASAHWIRSLRLPAWRLARLQERLHVHVNGAAVGAGAEIAAFAQNMTANKDAWFQLPELKYGLIPGAGGTASLPRRIGRQRTAFMALSMKKITAQTALEWGLVDKILS